MSNGHVDLESCASSQEEELQVLESIYPEFITCNATDGTLKLEIPVELEGRRSVVIKSFDERQPMQHVSVNVLPPILLHIAIPPTYPHYQPPTIVALRAVYHWLPDISALQHLLTQMWNSEPVLYNWIESIRTGDFLKDLEAISFRGSTINLPHPLPGVLAPQLIAYDELAKSSQFAQSSYSCSVCLSSVKGSKCLQLSCRHIFCRSCLEDFWKLCIQEGDIDRVGCPDPECVKENREASEEEVGRIVTDEELTRWRWLREKRRIEKDPGIIHCPIAVCQAPVPRPTDVETESSWSKLRQCPQCHFSFCAFCKRTWHGPLDKCSIAQYEEVAAAYLNAEPGSDRRAQMERRYGKANIQRLVATYEDEKANLDWLKASTMTCPGCQCYVEKNRGCNHMTCWKCRQHFCYKCGDRLQAQSPYKHFSNPISRCYNQLFDAINEEDEDEWIPMFVEV